MADDRPGYGQAANRATKRRTFGENVLAGVSRRPLAYGAVLAGIGALTLSATSCATPAARSNVEILESVNGSEASPAPLPSTSESAEQYIKRVCGGKLPQEPGRYMCGGPGRALSSSEISDIAERLNSVRGSEEIDVPSDEE